MPPRIRRERAPVVVLLARSRAEGETSLVVHDPRLGSTDARVRVEPGRRVPILRARQRLVVPADALERLAPEESSGLDRFVADVAASLERLRRAPDAYSDAPL